ncbi:MAG TPA: tetratricopeptide repeat protein [Pseudobdellovibrionaceae bacterium]|nr:tetratricopeptide repeat protein [Pseudobdellovibrionaceae bacterium]
MVRWFLLFLFVAGFSGCASTASQDKTKAELHMTIGNSHFEKGNYPYALQELLQAEKLDPQNPLIQNNLGLVYYMRERYDLAEKHIRRAIQLEPKFSDAKNNLARILIDVKRYEESEKLLKEALDDLTYAGGDRAWFNMGFLKFSQGQWGQAREAFEQSLKLNRDSCLTNSYYGRTLFELKDYKAAAANLDKAVGFCQKQLFDEPHYYSALAWYRSGDPAKAKARFQEILKLYPDGKFREKARAMLQLLEKGVK